jgi:hypothetical protein
MPIIERKPAAAFKRFRDHMRKTVVKTLPLPAHVRLDTTTKGTSGSLEFIRGDGIATAIPLQTNYGEVYFALTQLLEAVRDGRKYRLTTKGYGYRLLNRDDPTADAVLRWEYVADADADKWCRHHVQIGTTLPFGGGGIDLNRVHVPSGWVTIEEMLRFLIYDLGVPPVSTDWPKVIMDSEREFYENFTSKRYEKG